MKALKIKMYQETVCYRKPYAFKVTETYPLPPYSTIIGMLHNVIGAKSNEYHPMNVSVQGSYDGIFTSYNTTRLYKRNEVTSMPMNVHMLYGVNLIIHITAEEDTLNKIYNGFKEMSSAFVLGRNEDLARIDSIEFVNLEHHIIDEDDDSMKMGYSMYVPDNYDVNVKGIRYRLNKVYTIKNDLRQWEKVKVKYVEKNNYIDEGEYFIDDDKNEQNIVFLA